MDTITDKLTPPPPPDETGAPGVAMTAAQAKVVDVITNALRDQGIILTPESLVMKPAPTPEPPAPKPYLTPTEVTLLGRCRTFIVGALKDHGISLGPQESQWIGAAVADFVTSELMAGTKATSVGQTPAPVVPSAPAPGDHLQVGLAPLAAPLTPTVSQAPVPTPAPTAPPAAAPTPAPSVTPGG